MVRRAGTRDACHYQGGTFLEIGTNVGKSRWKWHAELQKFKTLLTSSPTSGLASRIEGPALVFD